MDCRKHYPGNCETYCKNWFAVAHRPLYVDGFNEEQIMTPDEKDRLIEIMRQNIVEKERYIYELIRENLKLKGKRHTLIMKGEAENEIQPGKYRGYPESCTDCFRKR